MQSAFRGLDLEAQKERLLALQKKLEADRKVAEIEQQQAEIALQMAEMGIKLDNGKKINLFFPFCIKFFVYFILF